MTINKEIQRRAIIGNYEQKSQSFFMKTCCTEPRKPIFLENPQQMLAGILYEKRLRIYENKFKVHKKDEKLTSSKSH